MASADESSKAADVKGPEPATAEPLPINLYALDTLLRFFVLSTTVAAVVVMVTSNQTKLTINPFQPFQAPAYRAAKFTHSPAFIYFIAATSLVGLYCIITIIASVLAKLKPSPPIYLLFHLAFLDALMAGILASAGGAAASVAYLGLKGNSHVGWLKICNTYTKFCRHIGSSVIISLGGSVTLVLLVGVSTYSLYRRCR
ncbi:hypothetical protein QJS04_geneDACA020136 [Acorus gramineus]|uniref:CASP-like protein n=1 Tax=Acorus gramineus TaxID=55184 RepID=A0AAV9BND0_ACOGR|nr:hypothetical protein QJS04_geneDACA020136 [Acorus gramineus]